MMSDAETKPRLLSRALRPCPDELFQLGFQLSRRSGGPAADRLTAYALFDLAARQGSIEAKVYRHELSGEMCGATIWMRGARQSGCESLIATNGLMFYVCFVGKR